MNKGTSVGQKTALVLFGMALSLLLLELGLRACGCLYYYLQEPNYTREFSLAGEYKIMCIGESTTAWGGADSYPAQLEKILNQKSKKTRFVIINKGLTSKTSEDILMELEGNIDKYKPQMIIAMMGINDSRGLGENIVNKQNELFLRSFRSYKFFKMLWFRVVNKAWEIGSLLSSGQGAFTATHSAKPEMINEKISGKTSKEYSQYCSWEELHRFYEFKEAGGENCNKALASYTSLLQSYLREKDVSLAVELIKTAREHGVWGIPFFNIYRPRYDFSKTEEFLDKTFDSRTMNGDFLWLGKLFEQENAYAQAKQVYERVIKINGPSGMIYRALGRVYQKEGNRIFADLCFRKSDVFGALDDNPLTVANYRRILAVAKVHGIKLVCVQYPMRNVEPLKKIFGNSDGVLFVDNELSFKKAVEMNGYNNIFVDEFAGDFGHATPQGNRLLAENIEKILIESRLFGDQL